jgi:hypothetical protein
MPRSTWKTKRYSQANGVFQTSSHVDGQVHIRLVFENCKMNSNAGNIFGESLHYAKMRSRLIMSYACTKQMQSIAYRVLNVNENRSLTVDSDSI